MTPKVVICTAIMGGYDTLKPQPEQSIPTDFVCFTDQPDNCHAPPWRVIQASEPPSPNHRLNAKAFKLMTPPSLGDYTHSIWIDGHIQIKSPDFAKTVIDAIDEWGWAMFQHPYRDCVYEECAASVDLPKYQGQPLQEQVDHYRVHGMPEHGGLWACGIIGREVSHRGVAYLGDRWMMENIRWSVQDQLSLPFVLWKTGCSVDPIPGCLVGNSLFTIEGHLRDD